MGLLGVLALAGVIVLYLYGPARYKGFFIRECQKIESTFDVSWGKQEIQTTLPGMIDNPDMNSISIKTILHKEELGDGDSILFRSRQSGAKVYLDDELVYDSGVAYNYPFLLGYGSFWRSVKFGEDYDGKVLTIELEPGYAMQAVSGYLPDIYFGTQAAFMVMILKNGFWYLLLTMFLIALGISLLIYGAALIRRKETHPLVVLGLFSVDTGLWMLIEYHVLELFVSNIPVIIYLSYLTYGLMPVLLIRFLLSYEEFKQKRYLQLLYLGGIVLNMVQLFMVMTGIRSEFESQGLNRVYLGLTVAGLLLAYAGFKWKKYGYGYDMMQDLSEFLQCTFSYVGYEKSAKECEEMLRNGELDIYTAAKITPEREKEFVFSGRYTEQTQCGYCSGHDTGTEDGNQP